MNTTSKVGRPATECIYEEVVYNSNSYIVATKEDYRFVFDKDELDKVKQRTWYILSSGYIASSLMVDGVKKQLLLHNFIMNRLTFPGKGTTESVDHINRNPLDNRKDNLRIVSQTEQNINQRKKPRNIV